MICWEDDGNVDMGRSETYMMLVITGINREKGEGFAGRGCGGGGGHESIQKF